MIVTTASRAKTSGNIYEVGATVEYSCNAGSFLAGPAIRTCLDTGFYNEFPPVCKSKEQIVRGLYLNEIANRDSYHNALSSFQISSAVFPQA